MELKTNENHSQVISMTADYPGQDPQELIERWAINAGVTLTAKPKIIRAVENNYNFLVKYSTEVAKTTENLFELSPNYEFDDKLTPFAKASLKDRYLISGEQSPQDAFVRAARAFSDNIAHAKRLYRYVTDEWFMFATPVLSNAPVRLHYADTFEENFVAACFGKKTNGMPISCFLNYVSDDREGITGHYKETSFLASLGGGVGGYWGALRSIGTGTSSGSVSSGVIPFVGVLDRLVLAFAQGRTRRASYAAYIDISHPEILEFLEIRKPTGGDANRRSLNLHNAVSIPDAFMEIIAACETDPTYDDSWPLVDPHTNSVVETVSAKELWQKLIDLRASTGNGEPFIFWPDAANRALPEEQKKLGLRVHQSNLCTEIMLATNSERTAVCCLSSVNLEKFDEWSKDPMFIPDLIRMLDNVLEYFINNAPSQLAKAVYSAQRERSVGLGAMGFVSYLQMKGVPYESAIATSINRQIFRHIKKEAVKATTQLAEERGACPDAGSSMKRNMHLLAIAPNASTSIFLNVSPSCEPAKANIFTHKTDSGSWKVKNKHLEAVLEAMGKNTTEVWGQIVKDEGSVKNLDFLDDEQKAIFKTFIEYDQRWVIEHAAHRQEYICQGQSLNTSFRADAHIVYLHAVHMLAWKKGLKSMYYLRSQAIHRADSLGDDFKAEVTQKTQALGLPDTIENLKDYDNACLSCEG